MIHTNLDGRYYDDVKATVSKIYVFDMSDFNSLIKKYKVRFVIAGHILGFELEELLTKKELKDKIEWAFDSRKENWEYPEQKTDKVAGDDDCILENFEIVDITNKQDVITK